MAAAATVLAVSAASAATLGDVTPDILYGDGNANGGFTIATSDVLELGLRAHLRYDNTSGCSGGFGCPQDIFNYDSGTNTYVFDPANSNAPANRSIFNFDFSINTDTADTTDHPSATVSAYTYLLSVAGPGIVGVVSFDPIAFFLDNAMGYNSTANGDGVEGGSPALYNVAQNSQNLGFGYSSNPQTPGLYTISLSASNGGGEVASTSINVRVVPLPAGLPLLLGAFGGLALLRRKRRQVA